MAALPLTLYGFWRSQATFRVRVALNLKGIAYREIPINIDRRGPDFEAFAKINPAASLPALIGEDATAMTQSQAILEYLEETHPEPALLPRDAVGRARVRALAGLAISDSHPLIVPRVRRYLADHADFDAVRWKAWQTHWFTSGLMAFEARLAGDPATGAFCHGDAPGLADICLCGAAAGAKAFGIEVSDIPTADRIVATAMALPAFEAARAENQADFPRP